MRFKSSASFLKMNSVNLSLLLMVLFLISISEAEKKKSVDKIIIHVPYKIYKHHHTHTKYKVITVPGPKKENTVIYLTEEKQPEIKLPQTHPQQMIIPPHQQSASALLQALATHKTKDSVMEAQEVSPSIHPESFKPDIKAKNFIPNFTFNQPQFLPISFQPMMLPHQGTFVPPYSFLPMIPPVQDNIAHSNNQVYKTIIDSKPKSNSYKVKEEIKEPPHPSYLKQQQKSSKYFFQNVPLLTKPTHYYKNLVGDEYEHVGYLIIDGNSRKIVGKNFRDEIKLSR